MKQYTFKDGTKIVASTREEAIAQHKATAANEDFVPSNYVLVPVDKVINKGWLLRFKTISLIDESTVGIKNGMKAIKKAKTIQKMIKLINGDA